MSKYYVFTINNFNEFDLLCVRSLVGRGCATYICFEPEVGESGTRHLQGYVELPARKRVNPVRQLLGSRAHVEHRRGTAAQARDYCAKDSRENPEIHFEEYGILSAPESGSRTDLDELRIALGENRSMVDISDQFFSQFLRYRKSIYAYKRLRSTPRMWSTTVIILWGPTGAGKTSSIINFQNPEDIWIYPGGGWFDGYNNHPIAIFDDFSGSEFKLPYLLKLLDRYPMQVPVKGDFVNWAPRSIYFTSNIDPNNWFPNAHSEHVAALFRRVSTITHMLPEQ